MRHMKKERIDLNVDKNQGKGVCRCLLNLGYFFVHCGLLFTSIYALSLPSPTKRNELQVP